ncbi:MAG: hypothetical protein GX213_13075 [Clostridiaceae bacterium]|nr:hypothetical protein [Clostridiaceae bacterium]
MLLPSVIIVFIFAYIPLYGLTIAFKNFNPAKGILGDNPWCGLDNFEYIFSIPNIGRVFYNTVIIAGGKIVVGTVVAIVVALLLNECTVKWLKHGVQFVKKTYPQTLLWNKHLTGPTKTQVERWSSMQELIDTYFLNMITGKIDIDTSFDQMVAEWNKLGGEQVTRDVNEIYNQFK